VTRKAVGNGFSDAGNLASMEHVYCSTAARISLSSHHRLGHNGNVKEQREKEAVSMLFAFTVDYRNHTSLVVRRHVYSKGGETIEKVLDVEVHGPSRLQIAVAVLNNYPMKLQLLELAGPVVVIEAGHDEEKLFKALQSLQNLVSPIRRDEDFCSLLEEPTLERLEAFIAIKKLMAEKASE
jgi:hypothetical protein